MPGTKIGGFKASQTNKERHGHDHYQRIGALGGTKSRGGGFASDKVRASLAGHKGGTKSVATRVANRDRKLAAGWRYQDKRLRPPEELQTTRVCYLDHRYVVANRDPEWDKKHGLKPQRQIIHRAKKD